MVWNKEFECMPLEQLQKFQLEKLKKTIGWVAAKIPFYKKKLEKTKVSADDIKSVGDISKLPFTVKNDLRDNYPFGLCAVPLNDIVRVHASSGTTGKPITGPYTTDDVEQWRECVARNLWAYGVRPGDIFQNAYGYGLFTGGLGVHQGASKIGCTVIPISSGVTKRQISIMKDLKTTVLSATPSYALTIVERAEEMNVDIRELPLKIGIFGAEPWTLEMRTEIEERMGIEAMDIYGLTELCGPGVAYNCSDKNGLHINEDHFIAEIIDPKTLEPLPLGEKGELVFTAIQRRAMPLLRYRTKDITSLSREKCSCGRTLVRMERISGRSDDMLIIKGVNVFPSQIESLLLDIPEVEPQYRLIVKKSGYLDYLTVQVETKKEIFKKGKTILHQIENKIMYHIEQSIGIKVKAELMEPKSIERSEGKAQRVIDERIKTPA
ncbi:MAG: phenylacetate--CoA ligase [Deltaproteobacteria bacterium]|nr:phenylacetate--CoA ligase [Deltaproteobacteria bacterium]